MRRLLYLGYYIKQLDREKFWALFHYVRKEQEMSRLALMMDIVYSTLRYNISLMGYFQFRFFALEASERQSYAGTGFMYEYQLVMNPRDSRHWLEDKAEFYKKYKPLVRHFVASIEELRATPSLIDNLLANDSGKVVLKYSKGQCGNEVEICGVEKFEDSNLLEYMDQQGYDVVEEFIVQHDQLMELSPSAVNTVRVFTQLNKDDEVEILGARLRIALNSHVDNLAYGNFAAPLDEVDGRVCGPAVYSDIRKSEVTRHPVTGVEIVGFLVPYWNEIISLVQQAALLHPENRSVGWDVAVTPEGPTLIEGNHNWCKLLWQLPVKRGLKPVLDKHLREYRLRGAAH